MRSGLFTTESYAIGYAAAWQARLSGLDAEVAEVAPRAAVKTGLEPRLFGLPPRACLWQRAGLWQGVSLASLVVAAFFAGNPCNCCKRPSAGRVLQLWAIAGDAAPVSLGVLPQDASAAVILPDALRPQGRRPGRFWRWGK